MREPDVPRLRDESLEHRLRLSPREGGADAVVNPAAERERLDVATPDVECVSAFIAALVVVRGAQGEHDRALKAVAKTEPAVAAALKEHETGKPPVPRLAVAVRRAPRKLSELDAVGKRQLEIAVERYNGAKRTAKQILASDAEGQGGEPFLPGSIERLALADAAGKPAYDAWLYMGDSGCIFRAGTEAVVAERIQAGLECADKSLRIALLAALSPPKKKTPAKKKAAARRR